MENKNSNKNEIVQEVQELKNEFSKEIVPDIQVKEISDNANISNVTKQPTPTEEQVLKCKLDTLDHIEKVRKYLKFCTDKMTMRGIEHDKSKLEEPELSYFAEANSRLAGLSYGSDEYKKNLEDLKPALDHHYSRNGHHIQHYQNGINDMNLIDVIEMLCDWKASTLRQHDGNLLKSIEINAENFKINKQLKQILINTAKLFEEI